MDKVYTPTTLDCTGMVCTCITLRNLEAVIGAIQQTLSDKVLLEVERRMAT